MKRSLLILLAVTVGASLLIAGCGGGNKTPEKMEMQGESMHSEHDHGEHKMDGEEHSEQSDAIKTAAIAGATMKKIHTAATLYTCPMHPEVVTTMADVPCPLCKMKLTQMNDDQVQELQESHPKGCVMCPIVVSGDSETETCDVCKMKLKQIEG